MSAARFRLERLAKHDRSAFASGSDPLDRYLKSQASQDVRRHVTACFVAVEQSTGQVAGYYTLSAADVRLTDVPETVASRLPRYPSVPVALVGRLAVDRTFRGLRLGSSLLYDAALRSARSEIAVFAILVDAKDESAAAFYRHHGFRPLTSAGDRLLLPISQIDALEWPR